MTTEEFLFLVSSAAVAGIVVMSVAMVKNGKKKGKVYHDKVKKK